jgi:hypothetical protein
LLHPLTTAFWRGAVSDGTGQYLWHSPILNLVAFSFHHGGNRWRLAVAAAALFPALSVGDTCRAGAKPASPAGKIFSCELAVAGVQPPDSTQRGPYTYQLIPSPEHTFGYAIFEADRLVIHQPSVPGLAGRKGFATPAQAGKAARLVIQKLQNNQFPPSLSVQELKTAGAL